MTRYRCIEEFVAHKVDGNGSETGECYLVRKHIGIIRWYKFRGENIGIL